MSECSQVYKNGPSVKKRLGAPGRTLFSEWSISHRGIVFISPNGRESGLWHARRFNNQDETLAIVIESIGHLPKRKIGAHHLPKGAKLFFGFPMREAVEKSSDPIAAYIDAAEFSCVAPENYVERLQFLSLQLSKLAVAPEGTPESLIVPSAGWAQEYFATS